MSEILKVENNNDLVRNVKTNAIVNVDKSAFNNYLTMVKTKKQEKQDLRDAIREINIIKNEMTEIKKLLINLTDKK
jgi:hypothetical protein